MIIMCYYKGLVFAGKFTLFIVTNEISDARLKQSGGREGCRFPVSISRCNEQDVQNMQVNDTERLSSEGK